MERDSNLTHHPEGLAANLCGPNRAAALNRGITEHEFAGRVRMNQQRLRSQLKRGYDFIVCGSGSSGCVVAGRLSENPAVQVLLIEAGATDEVPSVIEASQWPLNLGSERDWGFTGRPNPNVNGRSIPLSMGKVLGGGSSIKVMAWARGHKNDWDFFAQEAGETLFGGVVRPQSLGRVRLTGPSSDNPVQIDSNTLSHPDDLRAAIACVELCREVGNSASLRQYAKREVMPGNLKGAGLEDFIRDAASTYHHQTCTAKMGRDPLCPWWMAVFGSTESKTFASRMDPSCLA